MKGIYVILILLLTLFSACKKPKPIVFAGQLLLTKKNPIPLSNRKIEIFQQGANAIIMGSSGSSDSAVTDANGRFNIKFTPGTTCFAGLSGGSSAPLTLASTEGYPFFSIQNFPELGYGANNPIYVAKSIDSVFIKVMFF